MPNQWGEATSRAEMNELGTNFYAPSDVNIVRREKDSKKMFGGLRCQHLISRNGVVYGRCQNICRGGNTRCGRHGGQTTATLQHDLAEKRMSESERRRNKYAAGLPAEMLSQLTRFQDDESRAKLDDEIDLASLSLEQMIQGFAKDPKVFQDPQTTETIMAAVEKLARIKVAKNKIETSDQYLFTPTQVERLLARWKNWLREGMDYGAGRLPSPEVQEALSKVWHFVAHRMAGGAGDPPGTHAALPPPDIDAETFTVNAETFYAEADSMASGDDGSGGGVEWAEEDD